MLTSEQIPQADVPTRIIELVEHAASGQLQQQRQQRDASYYRSAARLLGFVDQRGEATPAGRALVALPAEARLSRFAIAFDCSDCGREWAKYSGCSSLVDVRPDTVCAFLRKSSDLSDSTLERRRSSLTAWLAVVHSHHPARQLGSFDEDKAPANEGLVPRAVLDRRASGHLIHELAVGTRHLRVATAYLSVRGYESVAKRLDNSRLRLLVGSEDAVRSIPDVLEYLRQSIERGAPTDEKRGFIHRLERELVSGSARVRLFQARHHERLHAKVYIFDRRAVFVTSANLTASGLFGNIEGGQLVVDEPSIEHYTKRFDELFVVSDDLLPQLLSTIEQSWAFLPPVAPYLLYLRVLIEVFGSVPDLPDAELQLADYQRMVVGSVLQVLRDEGGGLLIAPTGTGKTVMAAYTAAALFFKSVRRVFVLCPNESLASRWEQDFRRFALTCETITHGLVQEKGSGDGQSRGARRLASLVGNTRSTDLIIVDECHTFRNPKTTGYANLKKLLDGSPEHGRPKCLLLTATPMSTGLEDLNALLALVGREQLRDVGDIARSRSIVNITRPFIEEYFGQKQPDGGPPKLHFGDELRSFARVRLAKVVYPFALSQLMEAIQAIPFLITRKPAASKPTDQLRLPGLPDLPAVTPSVLDVGPLLRLMLMRAAESSPRQVARMLQSISGTLGEVAIDEAAFASGLDEVRKHIPNPEEDEKLKFIEQRLRETPSQKTLLFTNFVGTAEYLYEELGRRFPDVRFEILTGRARGKHRRRLLQRFAPKAQGLSNRRRNDDIDVLIATDAIAEGENLQDAVRLINYDLHWTPLRLIQRVGRIDRPTTQPREVDVLNLYPEGTLFEELLSMWGRLQDRSALYHRLARTRVLDDVDAGADDVGDRDHGLVRGIYAESDYERLLRDYLPTSTHLVQFAKASTEELNAARRLSNNFRSVKRHSSAGTFVLVRHQGSLHCVSDAVAGADALIVSPDDAAHEALIPVVSCDREEAVAPEPGDASDRVHEAVHRWATRLGLDPDEVDVVCSEALVT